jgi:hypothetical protein
VNTPTTALPVSRGDEVKRFLLQSIQILRLIILRHVRMETKPLFALSRPLYTLLAIIIACPRYRVSWFILLGNVLTYSNLILTASFVKEAFQKSLPTIESKLKSEPIFLWPLKTIRHPLNMKTVSSSNHRDVMDSYFRLYVSTRDRFHHPVRINKFGTYG